MFFLLASAIGAALIVTGLAIPVSPLLAIVAVPVAGSSAALAAGAYLVWRRGLYWRSVVDLDLRQQTDEMVTALREVAQQGEATAADSTVSVGEAA